ncbi:hypothetical protein ACLOJK_010059 [Asimina triloba]
MEALSLLKYWRASPAAANVRTNSTCTTTIAAASSTLKQPPVTDDEDDDEGPFFDLEFALPDDADDADDGDEDEDEEEEEDPVEGSEETDGEREFDLAVSSEGRSDPNLTLSPSDDLFFKGKLVPLEPSTFNPSSEPNSKTPQFPASFLKSATKFRIFLLGFKKPKPSTTETTATTAPPKQQQSKLFTVKLKVDDAPIVSLFTRDSSSRSSTNKMQRSQQRLQPQQQQDDMVSEDGVSSSDAKRFTKDVVHKYLKRIKPLYVKVSRKYGEKLRFSGQLSLGPVKTPAAAAGGGGGLMSGVTAAAAAAGNSEGTPAGVDVGDGEAEAVHTQPATSPVPPPAAAPNRNHLPAGLRVVCKHLGKSRSASAAVAVVAPSSAATPLQGQGQRRDDSLFQQQDGIQSAIAHCKKSFHASKEAPAKGKKPAFDSVFVECEKKEKNHADFKSLQIVFVLIRFSSSGQRELLSVSVPASGETVGVLRNEVRVKKASFKGDID